MEFQQDYLTATLLPDSPVLILHQERQIDATTEGAGAVSEILALFDSLNEPVILVEDIRGMTFDVEQVIMAANMTAGKLFGDRSPFHHPNIREVVFVNSSPLVKLAVKGLQAPVFGVRATCFDDLDQALAYAREQASKQAAA